MDEERYSAAGKSRLDFITDKLLEIASDLKSIVAVHDNRISTIEKFIVERKAEEFHQKEQLEERIDTILTKIDDIDKKQSKLQRYLWMGVGSGTVLVWIVLNLSDIVHFIQLFAKMV